MFQNVVSQTTSCSVTMMKELAILLSNEKHTVSIILLHNSRWRVPFSFFKKTCQPTPTGDATVRLKREQLNPIRRSYILLSLASIASTAFFRSMLASSWAARRVH